MLDIIPDETDLLETEITTYIFGEDSFVYPKLKRNYKLRDFVYEE